MGRFPCVTPRRARSALHNKNGVAKTIDQSVNERRGRPPCAAAAVINLFREAFTN